MRADRSADSAAIKWRRDTAGRYVSEDGRFMIARVRYGRSRRLWLWRLSDRSLTRGEYATLAEAKERADAR
jgi:hypothetical protein